MSNLIYQVKVGNPPNFYDTCIHSVIKYCQKYGIKHHVETTPILKIRPFNSKRSKNAVERLGYLPIYEKEVAFSNKYLDNYNRICIIDSDVYIRDSAPNIFDQLGNAEFAGVVEREMPLTPEYQRKIRSYGQGQYGQLKDVDWKWDKGTPKFYNMGVMLMSSKIKKYLNGQTPGEFIRRKEFEKFVNGEGQYRWSSDQTLLNWFIRKAGIKHKSISWKWNVLFKGVVDSKLPDAYFIHFFLSNNLPKRGAEIPEIIKNLDKAAGIKGHR